MSWQPPIYLQCADELGARQLVQACGLDWPAAGPSTGDGRALVVAPTPPEWQTPPVYGWDEAGDERVEVTPGVPAPGYRLMIVLNDAWDGYAVAMETIAMSGEQVAPETPTVSVLLE
jgi:hypothetical protein